MMKNTRNQFPKGLSQQKVRRLLKHYETQTEDQATAEDEAAYKSTRVTMMAIPVELVAKIERLITKRAG